MAKGPTVIWRDSWSNWRLHKGTARVWKGCRKLSSLRVGCHSVPAITWHGGEASHSRGYLLIPTRGEVSDGLLGSRESFPVSPSRNLRPACLPVSIPTCWKWQWKCLWPLMQHSWQINSKLICYSVGVKPEVPGFPAPFCFPLGRRQGRWMRSWKTQLVIKRRIHCSLCRWTRCDSCLVNFW